MEDKLPCHTYESDVKLLIEALEPLSKSLETIKAILRLKYAISEQLDDYGIPKGV